ncbi:hypothetical protein NFI96_028906 [Prochilodus magdalenae]|nr:hypothetical protein NFI96_028906 [Prochilodus magdalenae]
MICGMKILFLFAAVISVNFELYVCTCAHNEYDMEGECCPMCEPGARIYRYCTLNTTTACVPCVDLTFIDAPNSLTDCFSCTVCDPGQRLRVKTACTPSSDTVCEPLDGYYCTDQYRGSCIFAQKHTNCSPGQYIKHRGTAFKDTECSECSDGTYSDGLLQNCLPHSKCEDLGLAEIKAGTLSTDAECGDKTAAALIAGMISLILLIAVCVSVGVIVFLKLTGRLCTVQGTSATKYKLARRI